MTVTIHSGKIICKAKDDGINASGPIRKQRSFGRRNRTDNHTRNNSNPWDGQPGWPNRNNSNDSDGRRFPVTPPNDSYIISIYGGEIYLYTDSDGIDSNGHMYFHGGNINIFSEGQGANEPIDHNGNFTLFNTEVLGVGTKGLEMVHKGILKGNQKYAFHNGVISKDQKLEILDEKDKLVKDGEITKDINYIFYTSLKLNEKYKFYLIDEAKNNKTLLNMTFGEPKEGEDDQDVRTKYKKIDP